jgi:hypothetical protein
MVKNIQYQLEIKKEPYHTQTGMSIPQKAVLKYVDKHQREIIQEYGYFSPEAIYEKIKHKEPLVLDECYVQDFSLSEYRIKNSLKPNELIDIIGFSAKNAFFDSEDKVDFSFARFINGPIRFDGCLFGKSEVTFHASHFIGGDVFFIYVHFLNGNVDFSGVNFGQGAVDFKNTVFEKGDKDFQDAIFEKGNVSFINVEFNEGIASFVNTSFGDGDITFKICRFGKGKIDFHYARFGKGEKSFERTEFGEGNVDFRKVEFNEGKVNFNRSFFGAGNIDFEGSELLDGRFTFKRATFTRGQLNFEITEYRNSELVFDNTNFGMGNIQFRNAKVKSLSFQNCHINHYLDLRVSNSEYIDLSDTIVRDIIDLKPDDSKVHINTINYSGMRLLGRIFLDWRENNIKEMIKSQGATTSKREKADQFRILKENFNVTGQYEDEDAAYVEFKRYEATAILEEAKAKNPWNALHEYPIYLFKWLVFDQIGLYATNPVRVLLSMVVIYLLFTGLYIILPFISSCDIVSSLGDPDKLSHVAIAFYHSVVTFLTIGYGDYYPSGAIRWISGFEGFMGLFLMSYFTVAFVRKILR